MPEAPVFPYALRLVPDEPVPDLPSLDGAGRDGLAELLVDVLERLDRLFDAQTPYMLWIHQRPFDGGDWPGGPAARGDRVAVARAASSPATSPRASSARASTSTRSRPRRAAQALRDAV